MLTPILTILRQPASRRKWLTPYCGCAARALALSLADPAAGPVTAVLGTGNHAGPRGALIIARPPH